MTVRVGLLGTGFIARYHAMQLGLADEPNELSAVLDTDRARAEAFAADHGCSVVDDVAGLVDVCDAVFVCTWTAAHLDAVRAVVAAGLPVFCEKPLSTDLSSARELVEAVERSGVINMVGLVLRSSPALLALRELVRRPGSGAVMNVVFRDDQYLPTQGMYGSSWRGDPALAGSGTLLEHSIHDLDVLEWLLGDAVSVAAQQSHFHGMDRIEDSVSALFRFASGATATLASVWHDVLSRPSQRRIEVFCERSLVTLEGDVFGPVLAQDSDGELRLDGDELVAWLRGRAVPLLSAEQEFLVAVREQLEGGRPARLRPDVHDALRAHELVDAVYRSASADGSAVRIPPRAG
ncbi:MAG: Gfo/Idh/MocA family oxidoreductase [Actinomycetota bacterium]|nr:Gfo/Idh/MocA family oxidoreductase [Actinomycetota bacterium]